MPQFKLVEERYEGSVSKHERTASATPQIVANGIDRLDGKHRSMLALEDNSTSRVLIIGGGAGGVYVAEFSIDTDRAFFRLVRPDAASDEKKKLVVGGQAAFYRAQECVNRKEVQDGAEAFMGEHELGPGLRWEEHK